MNVTRTADIDLAELARAVKQEAEFRRWAKRSGECICARDHESLIGRCEGCGAIV